MLQKKEDFTLAAAKFAFGGKDSTSLFSQVELSWVTTFNPGFHFVSGQTSLRKICVYTWEVFTQCLFLDLSLTEQQEQQKN